MYRGVHLAVHKLQKWTRDGSQDQTSLEVVQRLWAAFELVATHALHVGARVFVEWPRRRAYWRNDRVVKFLTAHGLINADFDGCMYGLVASCGRDTGMPIQKPWRVACSSNSCLPSMLNRRCDGSHDHTPCQGQNTLLTQGYTPEIVKICLLYTSPSPRDRG